MRSLGLTIEHRYTRGCRMVLGPKLFATNPCSFSLETVAQALREWRVAYERRNQQLHVYEDLHNYNSPRIKNKRIVCKIQINRASEKLGIRKNHGTARHSPTVSRYPSLGVRSALLNPKESSFSSVPPRDSISSSTCLLEIVTSVCVGFNVIVSSVPRRDIGL